VERLIDSDCTVPQLWAPITLRNPEDGGDMFSETSVRTRATRYKDPKASVIDIAVKTSHRTVFFDPTQYSSVEKLSNSNSTVTKLCNPITLRNTEDGGDMLSETSVRTRATWYKDPEG
jgi:hypothetical protein